MTKKKQTKGKEKVADLHDACHEIEKLRQENLDLKEDNNQLGEAVRRYERVYGSVPAIDAEVESQAHGYSQMSALHTPIIVEEVAAVMPLLKDANGSVMSEATFEDITPQLAQMAVRGVRIIREAIAAESGEIAEDHDANHSDAGEEV